MGRRPALQASRRVSPIEMLPPVSKMRFPGPVTELGLVDGDHDGGVRDPVLGVAVDREVLDQLTQRPTEPVAIRQIRDGRLSR